MDEKELIQLIQDVLEDSPEIEALRIARGDEYGLLGLDEKIVLDMGRGERYVLTLSRLRG